MIRRPPRSTQSRSSAASDVYNRQDGVWGSAYGVALILVNFGLAAGIVAYTARISLGSVSYTHLRAHETVLDLVCRLLLENKNNDVTQNTTWMLD